jgi:hypothetical protein
MRQREDQELARILDERAEDDRALLEEFAGTISDGGL